MDEQPNYYAILPAEVRYDKRLTPRAILLYAEITALSSKTGICWASNDYFAKLYDIDNRTISRLISELVEFGYINREITYKENSKEIDKRFLIINRSSLSTKTSIDLLTKISDGTDKNAKEINTRGNITRGNKENKKRNSSDDECDYSFASKEDKNHFEEIWENYPRKEGKNTAYSHYKQWLKGRKFAGETIKLTERQMWYAVQTYNKECESTAREKQYIKMGSTFFNESIYEYVQKNELEGVYNEKNI